MENSKYLRALITGHEQFINRAKTAEKYYRNENDINVHGAAEIYKDKQQQELNPLKTADNRISHNWHKLLVDQKTGYIFTYPPIFDIGNENENKQINEVLGDDFAKKVQKLGIHASNFGISWLHYWQDAHGKFRYAVVDARQIVPIYSDDLEKRLSGVLRAYKYMNSDGEEKQRCEYWNDTTVKFYEEDSNGVYVPFRYPDAGEELKHGLGDIPFIPFANNLFCEGDLKNYKDLIDAYDKVYSGFNNDIDDVQEIVFVLKNYGGENKEEFIRDLKLNKTIKVDDDGGVDTIRAEIPAEARKTFLEMTRRQIFVSGMGVDPENEKIGNASGVALKHLYSLLELKSGALETEFRAGFAQLIRAICRICGFKEPTDIIQTWTRNMIQNDLETAQIASQSSGIISNESILKNHPWVENVEKEKEQLKAEHEEDAALTNKAFGMQMNTPPTGDGNEE